MLLIPAIDLKDGKCVRLLKGRFEDETVYGHDPAAMARRWAEAGARWIHLVDLDGSLGQNEANRKVLALIRKTVPIKLQLGGGLKSLDTIDQWFDLGINRLILGTVICENPDLVSLAAARYPGRIAAALDASGRDLKVWGWKRDGGRDLYETAAGLKDMGISLVIHTDVDRDGTQSGPNLLASAKVAKISSLPTIVSGGISGPDDLTALKELNCPDIIGAISGKALYEGNLDYAEGQKIIA